MNYEIVFERLMNQISQEKKKKTLLLHCCCAPCSSACIERLEPYFDITLFFYNPNIEEDVEYEKRKQELIRFAKEKNIKVLTPFHDTASFKRISQGHEQDRERGKRCYLCYELRLKKTAEVTMEKQFDYFGTTLSISPFKNANWINEIGASLEETLKIPYLYADFKKKNGYQRSIELSKEYGLYRQDYCGCSYSKKEREEKKNANHQSKREDN